MKFNKLFLLLSLSLAISISAQNANALKITNTFLDNHNFEMRVTADLSTARQNGFFIQFPAEVLASPVSVSSAAGSFWLKEDKTEPLKPDVIHWSRQENGILFLFASASPLPGEVRLQFQSFIRGKAAETGRIELNKIQRKTDQGFSRAEVIGSVELFQTKNNEIR